MNFQEEVPTFTWFKRLLIFSLALAIAIGAFVSVHSHLSTKRRLEDELICGAVLNRALGLEVNMDNVFKLNRPCVLFARMSEAQMLAGKGKIQEAMSVLEVDFSGAPLLSSLNAKLMWMHLALQLPPEKVNKPRFMQYLNSFNESSPLFARAKILQSLLLIREKDLKGAESVLVNLKNQPRFNFTGEVDAILLKLKSSIL